jgi:FtsZ-binding cell division protein ZapB
MFQEKILKANEELYDEAQRLNNEEAEWLEEKEDLQAKLNELSKKYEELDTKQCVSEAIAAKQTKIAEKCKTECERDHIPAISKLESESVHLQKCLAELQEEHDIVLSRKEKAAGENMQLIMETEEFANKRAELNHEVKAWKAKHKELERENSRLKIQLDMSSGPSKSTTSLQVILKEWVCFNFYF